MVSRVMILLSVFCLMIVSSRAANAYIDPGTGSYVLQVAVAGLLAAAFMVKSFWGRVARGFSKLLGRTTEDDGE